MRHPAQIAANGDALGAMAIGLGNWKVAPSPVPGDMRWRAMAVPGGLRRARNICIQLVVLVLLLLLTSPMAVLGMLQTASGNFNSRVDDGVTSMLQWVQRLSPTASHALLQYIPTLIIVAINGILLFMLHAAGR